LPLPLRSAFSFLCQRMSFGALYIAWTTDTDFNFSRNKCSTCIFFYCFLS
jgi:hypothetical protein